MTDVARSQSYTEQNGYVTLCLGGWGAEPPEGFVFVVLHEGHGIRVLGCKACKQVVFDPDHVCPADYHECDHCHQPVKNGKDAIHTERQHPTTATGKPLPLRHHD